MKCGDVAPLPNRGGFARVSCRNKESENNEGSLIVRWINHYKGENCVAAWRR